MAVASNSLVLRGSTPCEELRAKLELDVRPLKDTLDLFFVYEQRLERAPGVVADVWWDPVFPDVDVRLVCDDVIATQYVNVTDPDPARRRRILEELEKRLDVVSLPELIEDARRTCDERTCLRLALGVREDFDPIVRDVLCDGLASADAERRRAASQAIALLAWPELAAAVRAAHETERDPAIGSILELALREMQP
jgi:hypothetical protein